MTILFKPTRQRANRRDASFPLDTASLSEESGDLLASARAVNDVNELTFGPSLWPDVKTRSRKMSAFAQKYGSRVSYDYRNDLVIFF